jgi:FPC/CPF motif-containing protein YcgG
MNKQCSEVDLPQKSAPLFMDLLGIEQSFKPTDWQRILFKEFEANLLSETRGFPCVFGIAGLRANQLRYSFLDPMNAADVAAVLESYLSECRTFGPNTSLVVFSRPGPVEASHVYERRFWQLLRDMAAADRHQWPASIPEELDTPAWEFCFAQEAIFVVCNTPAHVNRQSRRASSFMVTFQPRWVFDGILGNEVSAVRAFRKVRDRLRLYDLLPPSPALGR